MGQAALTIRDLNTGIGVTLYQPDTPSNFDEPASPPFGDQGRDWKRAIVQHEIPTRSDDIGQDMGAHSREMKFGGICQQTIKDQLESWAALTQFTVAHPSGRFHVVMTARDMATLYDIQPLTLKNLSWKLRPGTAKWFTITVTFVEFHQT
jgi:hypothetical protein